MYFRLTKHLFLHIALPVLMLLSFFAPDPSTFWLTFFFAALHEGCHALMARLLRVPLLRITFLPYGCHLRLGRCDFLSEAKIAAAGPLGSFLLFLLFFKIESRGIHLALCLVNLLPALPLDGGRLLRLLLWRTRGVYRGNRILRRTGLLTGGLLLAAAFFLPSLLCGWIAALLITHALSTPGPSPLMQKKAAHATCVKLFHVRSTDSLLSLSHYYSPFYHILFFVEDEHIFLTETAVTEGLRQNAAARVSDAVALRLFSAGKVPPGPGRHTPIPPE